MLAQLNNFVIILLIVAAVISALLGDWVEAGAILLIVVLNAVLGVVQESRAEQALAALKKMASPEAHVLRDGAHRSVPAAELVPGDLVLLEAGNFVPADLRLLEAVNLRVEEAALTGESVAVEKSAALVLDADATLGDRKNTAFMGTTVAYGRGRGLVVATGMHTQLGLIADMLQNVEQEETPLQQRLDELGKVLGWGALAICGVVFLVGIVRSGLFTQPFTSATADALVESFMIAVSLAIAAVPEGSARRRHHQPGAGHARDGAPPCPDPQAGLGRDAGLGHRHLLGQDRHADAERDDRHTHVGGRPVCRPAAGARAGWRVSDSGPGA